MLNAVGIRSNRSWREGRHRRRTGCERHADHQCCERAAREAKTTIDQANAHCGDRKQVGADRHRADDEDLAVQEHAEARDHACRDHEREVAGDRPGVARGQAEHVFPDQARLARPAARPADDLHAHQRDLRFRHAQPTQVSQQLVDRPGMDSCEADRVPRSRRAGDRDGADVIVIVEHLPNGRHHRGVANDLELDHRRRLTPGGLHLNHSLRAWQRRSSSRLFISMVLVPGAEVVVHAWIGLVEAS